MKLYNYLFNELRKHGFNVVFERAQLIYYVTKVNHFCIDVYDNDVSIYNNCFNLTKNIDYNNPLLIDELVNFLTESIKTANDYIKMLNKCNFCKSTYIEIVNCEQDCCGGSTLWIMCHECDNVVYPENSYFENDYDAIQAWNKFNR